MIALLSALLGFFTSAAPKVFEAFQDRRDKAQEIELAKIQIQSVNLMVDRDLDKTLVQADSQMMAAVQQSYQMELAEAGRADKGFIVGLSASVRPAITYAFFLLYTAVKFSQFWLLLHPAFPWQNEVTFSQALVAIWGEEDMALFSAVMAFWFADRSWRRPRGVAT